MFTSGSTRLIRDLNQQHVLNLVRLKPGITAGEISRITSLQISTVLYTLRSLMDKGLIRKSGLGDTTRKGGKPPMMWEIDSCFGQVIGIELLSREIRLVLLDFNANIITEKQLQFKSDRTPQNFIEQVTTLVHDTVNDTSPVLGMGVGIPGFVDVDTGYVLHSALSYTHPFPLGKALQEHVDFPVYLDNTANCGALSAKWLIPDLRDESHIAYVSVNQNFSGMGVGFIFNNEIYRGNRNAAGEIKSFLAEGRLDTLIREAREVCRPDCFLKIHDLTDKLMLSDVIEQARRSDPAGLYILRRVTEEIAHHLHVLIDLFDPGIVVIGGDICTAEALIRPVLDDTLKRLRSASADEEPHVVYSPFGTYAVAMGASVLVYDTIFRNKNTVIELRTKK